MMQAYLNDPEVKHHLMTRMHENHAGLPPIKWPDTPAHSEGLDYEAQLGIPIAVVIIAEAVWVGADPSYAQTWPARVFDTIQPGQDLSRVGRRWGYWLFASQWAPGVGHSAWITMGERLLTLLAAAPLGHPEEEHGETPTWEADAHASDR